jgi:hypothetical protein
MPRVRPSQGAEKLGKAWRLLKKLQMQGRREEETGAYGEPPGGTRHSRGIAVVREDFRRARIRTAPRERLETDFPTDREATQQMDFFSSLLLFCGLDFDPLGDVLVLVFILDLCQIAGLKVGHAHANRA